MSIEGRKGGYEAKLTPKTQRDREAYVEYYKGWDEAVRELRPEEAALLESLRSSFDIVVLKDIFSGYLVRSGVAVHDANFGVLDNMLVASLEDAAAHYDGFGNHIMLNGMSDTFLTAMHFNSVHQPIPEPLLMGMQLTIIHEICHALSRARVSSEDISKKKTLLRSEIGYGTGTKIVGKKGLSKKSEKLFEALNEGVTERLAQEIFIEYEQRVGAGTGGKIFLTSYIQTGEKHFRRYYMYINEVNTICERIGAYIGIDKETVWKAFVRGYFEDPHMFAKKTLKLFKKTFGKNFLSTYKKLGNKSDLGEFGGFDATYGIPRPDQTEEAWLRHLRLSHE